jgi:hypothetical protein
LRSSSLERVDADKKFVDDDPQGPPVYGLGVADGEYHLRGQVVHGAAEGIRSVDHLLAHAEVH